ncbi:MAG: M16 family metallopeptidase [Limisphaerales bacterium]
MYKVTRLENGLTIATAEMPHMASVSLGIWVGIGSRYEPERISGISHFIEHLLFKGTKKRSAKQISQDVEGIGGYLNAFTSEENTCFYSKARHDCFDELLDVLTDMLLNSTFVPVEIGKERDVIKEELAMYMDQPQQYVHELLNATMWPDQPLGRSITGTEKNLNYIRRKHLVDFQRTNYIAPASLIAAAGRLNHNQVVKAVKRYTKSWPNGKRAQFTPAIENQTKPNIHLFTKKTEQTQLALGVRTCPRHDERRFGLRLLNAILGENMSSRLFQTIREDEGIAYSVYSSNSFFDDTGDLVISAGLDEDNLERTLKIIVREMKKLRAQPVSKSELRRACDYVIGQLELSLENSENQMMWVGEHMLGYGKIFEPDKVKARLGKVTASDIRNAANEFFVPNRLNLALISPMKSANGFEKILAA